MSAPLRSKQGCWTCRLRKKKCDESRPLCSLCTSLSITCYGYGPRPDWMDNGEKEKAVANSIKEIVKHTSRRKATTQPARQQNHVIRIAPNPYNTSMGSLTSVPAPDRQRDTPPPSDHSSSQEESVRAVRDASNETVSRQDADQAEPASVFSIPAEETTLLMHFLDDVFPLQYPMYKPSTLEGGRGWLLPLVLRTKSLYHAALTFGAYYRTITLPLTSQPSRVAAKIEQGKHFESCIKSLNKFGKNFCPYRKLGIVTTVVQLIFYELFTGDGDTWQPHLRAAIGMYERANDPTFEGRGLIEKSRKILFEDHRITEYEAEVTEEVANFRSVFGTVIWLDILSSITGGTSPRLLRYHSGVITPNSQTKLQDITGCKDGVMLLLSRLAAIHGQRSEALQHEAFDCSHLEQTVDEIHRDIQSGLTQSSFQSYSISASNSATTFNATADPKTLVTQMFLHMAFIYLHILVQGFQNLILLDSTILEAMATLRSQTPIALLPSLVCPLFFLGSVARECDMQFFRNAFSSPPLLDPLLKHRGKILPILEEIWSKRETVLGFGWEDCVILTKNILLI